MAGSSAEGELNPWPAFVDVLTTVIMVVTFLLVIMSAAVMTLAQKIVSQIKVEFSEKLQSELAAAKHKSLAPPSARDGLTIPPPTGESLLDSQSAEGEAKLVARSRIVPDNKHIKVAAPTDEIALPKTGTTVRSAAALFAIDFDPSAVKLTADAEKAAMTFVKAANLKPTDKVEVWSIVPSSSGTSRGERLGYYRALGVRNILIKAGIDPKLITAQVKVSDALDETNVVNVLLKP